MLTSVINQQFINSAILNAFPFFCILAAVCFKWLEGRLPAKQQATLNAFVAQATTMVEQLYGGATPLEKKNLAIQATIELFRAFHLPVPPLSALSTTIEASVYALHQAKQAQLASADAKQVEMAITARMPVVKPQFQQPVQGKR